MKRISALCTVSFILLSNAWADEVAETKDGRQIILHDDGTYKFLDDEQKVAGQYKQISIANLKLDIESMHGQAIETAAKVTSVGAMVMLSDPKQMYDPNPVTTDSAKLSGSDRQYVLTKCNLGCKVTVRGVIKEVLFRGGIELHELVY
ncbi:hypothetical protein [Pseudaminobacter soli (ex Li et al. 2025)]|uniref:Organic solvent tolerance-like N-terminal domain-containing protein n=1 Tax=Pseudaminobacter soli (ex Li et al. 2025) TaxID=1295366 RepID=A0A2P7SB75_9HYPH|nr:hypothetical protein [Mesorhizobium soli]PSJ59720.1 hypothetical protein C7I85_15310 [Mesorhizobium soli]